MGWKKARFKLIKNFPNYAVSKDGKVFSLLSGAFLKLWQTKGEHLCASISNKHGKHKIEIHRLVILTFGAAPKRGEEVCHRDGNPRNNCLYNLSWGQRGKNIQDYRRLNGKHWAASLTIKQANKIRSLSTGERGEQKRLARKFGVSIYVISDILSGKSYR